MNFTNNFFSNSNQKKNIILPPNHSEDLRYSTSYGKSLKKIGSNPKIYNANYFGGKTNELVPNFLTTRSGINTNRITTCSTNRFHDYDKLQDDNLKLKIDLNKKLIEYNQFKVDFQRLEEENKRNNKLIEQFIQDSTKFSPELDVEERTNNYREVKPSSYVEEMKKNLISENNFTPYKINPAENLFVSPDKKRNYYQSPNQASAVTINNLKRQINSYKQILKVRDEELFNLKSNSKVSKYNHLETDYRSKNEELFMLRNNYKRINEAFNEQGSRFKELAEEKEYYKNNFTKIKIQLDETKSKLKTSSEELSKLQRHFIDKRQEKKFITNYSREITESKVHSKLNDTSKADKEEFQTKLIEAELNIQKLNEMNEQKSNEILELEKDFQHKNQVLSEIQKNYTEIKSKNCEFQSNIQEMNNEINFLKETLIKKDNLISQLQDKVNSLNKYSEELDEKLKVNSNRNQILEESCKVLRENEVSNIKKIADLEENCKILRENESSHINKLNNLEDNYKNLKENEAANLLKIVNLEECCRLLKENESINLVKISSLEENYKVLSENEQSNLNKLKILEETIKQKEVICEDLNEKNRLLRKENEEYENKYKDIKEKAENLTENSKFLSISYQINNLNFPSSILEIKKNLNETDNPHKELEITFHSKDEKEVILDSKCVNTSREKAFIMKKLEKKNSLIKEKKDNSGIVSNLDIKQIVEIKSPTAERNLTRKDSGKSLQLPIPTISIAIPQEEEDEEKSKESEPQDFNPTQSYFVKSGVASRRPSNQSELKYIQPKKKSENENENEMEKIITERMKAGEDFEAIFSEMNLKPQK